MSPRRIVPAAIAASLLLLGSRLVATAAPPANDFAAPGNAGVGVGWLAHPPTEVGKKLKLVDGALRIEGPEAGGRRILACQAEHTPVSGRTRVVGKWKNDGLQVDRSTDGLQLELRVYDAADKRIPWDENGMVARGAGPAEWSEFRTGLVLPPEAVSANLCVEVRRDKGGGMLVKDLAIVPTSGSSAGNGKNVLFIVVDTLRADAVGAYGQKKPLTPNMDRFASQSHFVKHAWTQYTCTTPSFVSYMLSQYARTHGYTYSMDNSADRVETLAKGTPTLAQVLQDDGYITAGISANGRIRPSLEITRGFESWDGPGTDDKVVEMALADMATWTKDGAPNFLYTHLMSTHVALTPSAKAQAVAGVKVKVPEGGIHYWTHSKDRMPTEAEHNRMFRDAYFASANDADTYFQQILDGLEATGEADNTMVAFFSDHGELLGEHDLMGHGNYVWEQLNAVPMMVRTPGAGKGVIDDRVGQLIDIAPTVLEYLGRKSATPAAWQGESLLGPSTRKVGASERADLAAFTIDARFKAIEGDKGGLQGAYDLNSDPTEAKPLDGSRPEVAAITKASAAWRGAIPAGANVGEKLQVSEEEVDEELEQMRALGYIE